MKRIIFMVTVALVMAAMLAVAGSASATIHPLANSECADENASAVAQTQDPPGLTPGALPTNAVGADVAQPVFAVFAAQGASSPAFKTPPAPGPFEYCPAQN